jgi:hypothetical protein
MKILTETQRLYIREILPGDIDCLLGIYRDDQNMKFIPNSNFNWTRERLKEKYHKITMIIKTDLEFLQFRLKTMVKS